jgi:hypothetical protein
MRALTHIKCSYENSSVCTEELFASIWGVRNFYEGVAVPVPNNPIG